MTKILRRVSNDGLLPARDLGFSAAVLFGLCRSALIHRVLTGDRRPLEARTSQVARLFLHGARGPA